MKYQIYLYLFFCALTLDIFAMNQQFQQHSQNEKQYPKIIITKLEQQNDENGEDISQILKQSKNIISLREVRVDEILLDLSLPKALKTIKRLTGEEISLDDLKLKPLEELKKICQIVVTNINEILNNARVDPVAFFALEKYTKKLAVIRDELVVSVIFSQTQQSIVSQQHIAQLIYDAAGVIGTMQKVLKPESLEPRQEQIFGFSSRCFKIVACILTTLTIVALLLLILENFEQIHIHNSWGKK